MSQTWLSVHPNFFPLNFPKEILLQLESAIDAVELPANGSGVTKEGR